jgi:hypothetical protein
MGYKLISNFMVHSMTKLTVTHSAIQGIHEMGCDAIQSGASLLEFQRNVLRLFSGLKSKSSKWQTALTLLLETCSFQYFQE